MKKYLFLAVLFCLFGLNGVAQTKKEWTVLVFLNGHNDLFASTDLNINQMKQVGSSKNVNIAVQWAHLNKATTERFLVQKNGVKMYEELQPIDMGSSQELINFVEWGHRNFPAKKYFLIVWDHGFGWHDDPEQKTLDISQDDRFKSVMTTEKLGEAMKSIQQILGQPVELFGADACQMSMFEVVSEMGSSAKYFVGSQFDEPDTGWPYHKFLRNLVHHPEMNGRELGQVLVNEYYAQYLKGKLADSVTLSTLDISLLPEVEKVISQLSTDLLALPDAEFQAVFNVSEKAQQYTSTDYKDAFDLFDLQKTTSKNPFESFEHAQFAIQKFVTSNMATPPFQKSHGVSIWVPTSLENWNAYSGRYLNLQFNQNTHWGEVLKRLYITKTPMLN
jgi:hypothetical protein